jgi:hypothetical protein
MTRKASQPVIRGMARRGDDGPWIVNLGLHSPFVIEPSEAPRQTLADRYVATAMGEPSALQLTITDRETGATIEVGDERMTLTGTSGLPPKYVGKLWKDAKVIVGVASRQGRPTGTTSIQNDGEILRVIADVRRADRKVNLKTIVAAASFTYDELRGYLEVNGKRIKDGRIVPRE